MQKKALSSTNISQNKYKSASVCLFVLFWRHLTRELFWHNSISHKVFKDGIIAIYYYLFILRKSQYFPFVITSFMLLLILRSPWKISAPHYCSDHPVLQLCWILYIRRFFLYIVNIAHMISHSDTFILLQSSLIFGHTFSLFFYKYTYLNFVKKHFVLVKE